MNEYKFEIGNGIGRNRIFLIYAFTEKEARAKMIAFLVDEIQTIVLLQVL